MSNTELKIEIDEVLLEQACAAGLDLVRVIENALRKALPEEAAEERARRWAEENAEAIKAHRERIEKYGVRSDDLRTW